MLFSANLTTETETMKTALIIAAALALAIGPAYAQGPTKRHHHHRAPAFNMAACLKAAAPLYASPDERKAVCDDMRAGA
jgi:hypothetical protein